jgi:undecaprenyl pyrophosphate phosphatase UppP
MFELVMAFAALQLIIESLPISSSGHVQLLQFLLARWGYYTTEGLSESLDHALHGPALLILAIYFRAQWWPLLGATLKSLNSYVRARCVIADLPFSQRTLLYIVARIVGMVVIADVLTALGYFLFRDALHAWVGGNVMILAIGFMVTMMLLMSSQWCKKNISNRLISYPIAMLLGIVQGSVALFPGISRFACTIMCARWCGVNPRRSLQFSFLMFAPLIIAAFTVKGIPALLQILDWQWFVVLASSTLIAYPLFVGSCWLALTNRWWWLSYYMIIPIGLCFLIR